MTPTRVDVLAARLRAHHLHERRPPGSLVEAAWAGLQDSAPRSALLSLHARVEGVGPDDWQHPDLVQVWGPRGAVWVVPADDVAVFTLGLLPRGPAPRPAVPDAVPDEWVDTAAVGLSQHDLRAASAKGTLRLRWDGSRTLVRRVAPPEADEEDARRELCRRFLALYAPATVEGFAAWAGVPVREARETWVAVRPPDPGGAGAAARPVRGVRLLPPGDPWLNAPDRDVVVPDPRLRAAVWPAGGVPPGAVLADGEVVATWRRREGRVVVTSWLPPARRVRAAVEAEAAGFPLGVPVGVSWE